MQFCSGSVVTLASSSTRRGNRRGVRVSFAGLIALLLVLPRMGQAQLSFKIDGGDVTSFCVVRVGDNTYPFAISNGKVYSGYTDPTTGETSWKDEELFDGDAVAVANKAGSPSKFMVLDKLGQVWVFDRASVAATYVRYTVPPNSNWERVAGDAVYMLSSSLFVVTRDTGASWQRDTSALGSLTFNAFALDTSQYVYLATSGGIFKQHPDSSVWHKLSSFSAYPSTIFIDARNRIYVSSFSSVYYSTDGGSTWKINSTGLGTTQLVSYGEDAFHNIYGIGSAKVFRSDSGTGSWVRIDTAITNKIKDPVQPTSPFNQIGGDTVLFLATNYGLFSSTDFGSTWSEANKGITATTIYGYTRSADRQFASTSLGLYYGRIGDTVWTKSFPANGYAAGKPIFIDSAGTLYTQGPVVGTSSYFSTPTNWKSTDDGATWSPDTAGFSAIHNEASSIYSVDMSGHQHYMFSGTAVGCYQKVSGSSWAPDTAGFPSMLTDYPSGFGTDNLGNLYASIQNSGGLGLLLRRPVSGGTWVYDTAGLQGAVITSFTPDGRGNLYAGTFANGLFKKSGGTWTALPVPSGFSGYATSGTAINPGGTLFVCFAVYNISISSFSIDWYGVYSTSNNGATWTYVGLDSTEVDGLVSYGDTVYALSNGGLYPLTASSATGLARTGSLEPNLFALFQNYPNPFNPTTRISFQLAARAKTTLRIYDLLGREVETLVDGEMDAGAHEVSFDATRFASGVYFYRLRAGNFEATKKLVLLK